MDRVVKADSMDGVRLGRRAHPAPRCRLTVEALEGREVPTAGVLDPTFGHEGVALTPPIPGSNGFQAATVTVEVDGKVLVVGDANVLIGCGPTQDHRDKFTLTRYNADGTLDTSFGQGGVVLASNLGIQGRFGSAVAVQADGKILITFEAGSAVDHGTDFGLARFNPDGTLDTTFGVSGLVTTDLGPDVDHPAALAVQADGKVVVAGTNNNLGEIPGGRPVVVVRYHADGTPDTTFGTNGIARGPAGQFTTVRGVTVGADGRITVAGANLSFTQHGLMLTTFHADGTLDTTFGTNGQAITDTGGHHYESDVAGVVAQPDGKLVVVGTAWQGISQYGVDPAKALALVRYNADGSLDTTFGTGGIVTAQLDTTSPHVRPTTLAAGIVLQPDGRLVIAGTVGDVNGRAFVARFDGTGQLDATFGTGGVTLEGPGAGAGDLARGTALTLQPDGRIVVAGVMQAQGALWRFQGV